MAFARDFSKELSEFGQLLFLGCERGYLAVLGAYIDESGAPESGEVLVLSGFYTTPKHWAKILREWLGIVHRSGVTRFHTTDCANGYNEFEGWSNTRKKNMFTNLINIVSRHSDLIGCSAGIALKDYKEVVSPEVDEVFGGPRSLTFQLLVMDMVKKANAPIAFIVDKPPKGWGILDDVFEKTKALPRPWCSLLHSLTPGNVRTFPAIQIADLLAYETYRLLNKRLKNEPPRKIRKSMLRLMVEKSLSGRGPYLEKRSLLRLIEEYKKDGILKS
jgi:hypothetical protein